MVLIKGYFFIYLILHLPYFSSYLWYFVSKFTEYDAKKLNRMYRKASKKSMSGDDDPESKSESRSKKDKSKRVKEEVNPRVIC